MSAKNVPTESLNVIVALLQHQQQRFEDPQRTLTPQEQSWLKHLRTGTAYIRDLLGGELPTSLTEMAATQDEPLGTALSNDGRYQGNNSDVAVVLRVDEGVSGVISGDLFRIGAEGNSYVASFRTAPGVKIKRQQLRWVIIGQDEHGKSAQGTLQLVEEGTNTTSGQITFEQGLNGLPVRAPITFKAERVSHRMRELGIEWEREESVEPPKAYDHKGNPVTIESSLQDAGFDLIDIGQRSIIPTHDQGWGTTQLHTIMQDFAQASLSRRAWELHVLMLSASTRRGLLGVMFDSKDPLPRQGTAIFASAIRGIPGIEHDRKLIQTTVHEIGHALNLAHRFERSVGRADSHSFMNYDWRYGGGNKRDEFWNTFQFQFDHDELEFMRHAPLPALIPGGAPFHSVNYWSDGHGGYSPYVPEVDLPGFELKLSPPLGGPVFEFGQPVFLEASLTNRSGNPVKVPPSILDPKTGMLELLVRRRGQYKPNSLADTEQFTPVMTRCFDLSEDQAEVLPDGGTMRNNLNLTYGSAGFQFAEPGEYDIIALVAIYDQRNQRELVLRSPNLRIRVSTPKSRHEERDAFVLLRDDVGLYMALGGSTGLNKAQDDLRELRERRKHRVRDEGFDPIVANIIRCEGINAGRRYLRYSGGQFIHDEGDRTQAALLLESLDMRALQAFDSHTAEHTQKLARRHRQAATGFTK